MKTGISYFILRPITRFALGMYFSRIEYAGLENIPMDAPVIIASNHPSSFLEACTYASVISKPVHFLTRGDMMKNPYLKWFFNQTNQIAIYRFRDGMADMRKNQESLSKCIDVLKQNGRLVIFAEGGTKLEKRLKPLQKGAVKIALDAMKQEDLAEIYLVPVGINFENPLVSGKYCCMRFGEPITMNQIDFKQSENSRSYIDSSTDRLHEALKMHVIHTDSSEAQVLLDHQINQRESTLKNPVFFPYVKSERTLDRDMKASRESQDTAQVSSTEPKRNPLFEGMKYIFASPTVIAHTLTQKHISSREFQAPVKIGLSMALYAVYLILIIVLACYLPKVGLFLIIGLAAYMLIWRLFGINKEWSISI